MKHPVIGKALILCAALSLPVLAAAPASKPMAAASASSARVIVKFKNEGPLMRESALAARAGELPRVQHAARLTQRLGVALSDGYAVAPRTQVLHAKGISSADLVARLQLDPDVEFAEVDARVKRAAAPNDPRYPNGQTTITPVAGQWYLRPPTSQPWPAKIPSASACVTQSPGSEGSASRPSPSLAVVNTPDESGDTKS
jgi:serine protease